MTGQRCGARADMHDRRRCTLPARHDGWHQADTKTERVRWRDGSYEIEMPTRKKAA